MNPANSTDQESTRLQALDECDILDTEPEAVYDRITRLAGHITHMPTALISLVDHDRQWFKSKQGLSQAETPRDDAFCHYTIQTREPLVVTDARTDDRFRHNRLVTGPPHIRTYVGIPLLLSEDVIVGSLCVIDYEPRELVDWQIEALCELAGVVVELLESRRQALVDPLTRTFNRRMLSRLVHKEIAHYARHQQPFCFILLDLDNFKAINDQHGHPAGDTALRRIAECWNEILREEDTLCRMGGEEFGVLLIETELAKAVMIGERLRTRLQELSIELDSGRIQITTSLGVTEYAGGDIDMEALLNRADEALYQAKQQGRNRLVAKEAPGV